MDISLQFQIRECQCSQLSNWCAINMLPMAVNKSIFQHGFADSRIITNNRFCNNDAKTENSFILNPLIQNQFLELKRDLDYATEKV